MTKEKEIWQGVPNYERYYLVSSWGRFWSLRRDKELSLSADRGYLKVGLRNGDAKSKTFRAHRLVALVFCDNPDNKPEVNHDDFDKSNNYYKNLIWATGEENRAHFYSVNVPRNKAVLKKCLCGNLVKEYPSLVDAGNDMGISTETISACAHGRTKTSGGYKWKFKD